MRKSKMRPFGVGERVNHDSDAFYNRKFFTEPAKVKTADSVENKLDQNDLNRIYVHSSENMHELSDNSIHLMVTSPPYNVGKEYDDDLTASEYRDLLRSVWQETYRVLVDGGRACINVANVGRKPYIPLNALITSDMLDIGFSMRGEIIWNKAASAGTSCAWGSWMSASNPVLRDVHEYILVYSKGSFSRKKAKENKSTIERDDFLEWTKSIWSFPAESAKRVGHPAPYPIELPRRTIDLYTFENDVVLDPFIGSGTAAVAAERANRRWVGYETSEDYANLARQRIEAERTRQLELFRE